jgi:uncharacterized delta-60 repeat protein
MSAFASFRTWLRCLFLIVVALACVDASAASGTLLRKVLTPLPKGDSGAFKTLVQPDGKILLVGYASFGQHEFAVTRLNANGTVDTAYGSNHDGTQLVAVAPGNNEAFDAALQADGKLVVAGHVGSVFTTDRMAVARLNADGTIDTTFANRILDVGPGNSSAHAVEIQPDGRILLAGSSRVAPFMTFTVVRLNTDGSVDTSYGVNGVYTASDAHGDGAIDGTVLQPDGKLLVVGDDGGFFKIQRVNANGTLDTTWGAAGSTLTTNLRGRDIALEPNGEVVVGGNAFRAGRDSFAVALFTPSGAFDPAFGTAGIALAPTATGQGFGVLVQPDGRIVLTGLADDNTTAHAVWLFRFNTNGTPDASFGVNGEASLFPSGHLRVFNRSVAIRPDGRLVVGGSFTFEVFADDTSAVSVMPDGTLDTTFNGTGRITLDLGSPSAFATASVLQGDGKLLVAGTIGVSTDQPDHGSFLARYLADGTLDTAFGASGLVLFDLGNTEAIALQSDGRIVVGGQKQLPSPTNPAFLPTSAAFARFNADGTLDASFGSGGIAAFVPASGQTWIKAIAIQADGNIVGAGFSVTSAGRDGLVMRVTPAGTLDTTFGTGGAMTVNTSATNDEFDAIALQADGRIVVAGAAETTGTQTGMVAARLDTSGALDASFGGTGQVTVDFGGPSRAFALGVQPDGKLVLGGFAHPSSTDDYALARLLSDGTLDAGFGSGGLVTTDFAFEQQVMRALRILPSGKIVGAGTDARFLSVVQYLPNGALDEAFGIGGHSVAEMNFRVIADIGRSLSIAPNGTLYVAGDASNVPGLAIFTGDPQSVVPPAGPPRLFNISTRGPVLTGEDVLIGGFVIGGSSPKTVMVVAIGPSLAGAGIPNALADPTMTLVRSSDGAILATNNDWQSAANADAMRATGLAPANARESAILMTLPPGAYTAIVSGVNGSTGVGLVAVYEVDHPEVPLTNISTRGRVLTGNSVLIAGLIVTGDAPQTVVITAAGPSLASAGIAQPLQNPTLTLVRSSDQAVMATNDDWQTAPNADAIRASGFAPSDPREPAIMLSLPPGAYTAILSGVNNTSGVAVIGVFATN